MDATTPMMPVKPFYEWVAIWLQGSDAWLAGDKLSTTDTTPYQDIHLPYACVVCKRSKLAYCSLLRCAKCKRVYYCGREHQQEDWSEHKKLCKILQPRPLLCQPVGQSAHIKGQLQSLVDCIAEIDGTSGTAANARSAAKSGAAGAIVPVTKGETFFYKNLNVAKLLSQPFCMHCFAGDDLTPCGLCHGVAHCSRQECMDSFTQLHGVRDCQTHCVRVAAHVMTMANQGRTATYITTGPIRTGLDPGKGFVPLAASWAEHFSIHATAYDMPPDRMQLPPVLAMLSESMSTVFTVIWAMQELVANIADYYEGGSRGHQEFTIHIIGDTRTRNLEQFRTFEEVFHWFPKLKKLRVIATSEFGDYEGGALPEQKQAVQCSGMCCAICKKKCSLMVGSYNMSYNQYMQTCPGEAPELAIFAHGSSGKSTVPGMRRMHEVCKSADVLGDLNSYKECFPERSDFSRYWNEERRDVSEEGMALGWLIRGGSIVLSTAANEQLCVEDWYAFRNLVECPRMVRFWNNLLDEGKFTEDGTMEGVGTLNTTPGQGWNQNAMQVNGRFYPGYKKKNKKSNKGHGQKKDGVRLPSLPLSAVFENPFHSLWAQPTLFHSHAYDCTNQFVFIASPWKMAAAVNEGTLQWTERHYVTDSGARSSGFTAASSAAGEKTLSYISTDGPGSEGWKFHPQSSFQPLGPASTVMHAALPSRGDFDAAVGAAVSQMDPGTAPDTLMSPKRAVSELTQIMDRGGAEVDVLLETFKSGFLGEQPDAWPSAAISQSALSCDPSGQEFLDASAALVNGYSNGVANKEARAAQSHSNDSNDGMPPLVPLSKCGVAESNGKTTMIKTSATKATETTAAASIPNAFFGSGGGVNNDDMPPRVPLAEQSSAQTSDVPPLAPLAARREQTSTPPATVGDDDMPPLVSLSASRGPSNGQGTGVCHSRTPVTRFVVPVDIDDLDGMPPLVSLAAPGAGGASGTGTKKGRKNKNRK